MTKIPCAIWNTPAEHLNNTGDGAIFDSPRAGGRYWISGTAMDLLPLATDQTKLRLTTWLCEQRRAGIAVPKVDSDSLSLVGSRRSLTVTDRPTSNTLQNINNSKIRWEPAVLRSIFGKLLGTSTIATVPD